MGKSLSNKYDQKLLDSAKKSTTGAIKTASKRAIQKTVEATVDLINNNNEDAEITAHKKRSLPPEERQQIINELRLVPKKDEYF